MQYLDHARIWLETSYQRVILASFHHQALEWQGSTRFHDTDNGRFN